MKASAAKRSPFFYFNLWISLYKNTIQRALEYRVNFFGRALTELVWISSQVLFVYAIGGGSARVGNWGSDELLLFFGFMTLIDALFMLFLHDNLHEFESLIRQGTFDFHLLRPVSSVFLCTLRFPNAVSIVNFIYSLVIIIFACIKVHASLSLASVLLGLLYLFLGFILIYLFNVFIMSVGFIMSSSNILVWLYFEFYRLSFRPDDFYFTWLRRILFTLFPAAFFISIPVKVFLGKELSPWLWAGPWVLVLLGILGCSFCWRRGIKHYEGALS